MFAPVQMEDGLYVDGAVFDNFQVKPLKGQCEEIIGINIMPHTAHKEFKGLKGTAMRALVTWDT